MVYFVVMKKLSVLLVIALLSSMTLFGGGFQINLQGQKQTGMGHTGTGLCLDNASILFNPGALSFLDSLKGIYIGASFIMPRTTYSSKREVFGLPAKPQPPSVPVIHQHQHQQQAPGLIGSMVQGFGLGMGSSIARNMIEHSPAPVQIQVPQQTPTKTPIGDYKTVEFKQCMEKTYNNYDDCVHHLE